MISRLVVVLLALALAGPLHAADGSGRIVAVDNPPLPIPADPPFGWAIEQAGPKQSLTIGRAIANSDADIVGDVDFPQPLGTLPATAIAEMCGDAIIARDR